MTTNSNKKYVVQGGYELNGTIQARGAKNAITKQLVASVLTDEPCIFNQVPRISEIDVVLDMLSDIGTIYEWLDDHTIRIQTKQITNTSLSQKYSGVNRIPILMLGPLIQRVGEATVPVLGGCRIGDRPVDFHLDALEIMGATIEANDMGYTAAAVQLKGTHIELPYPSVGATENIIMSAVLTPGTTIISNAAVEPEIIDTILFLQKMGALIQVDVDRRVVIEGVKRLHGTTHRTVADRIEVASFAAAAVATDGRIKVKDAQQSHMITYLNLLRKVGGGFEVEDDGITFFRAQKDLIPAHIETDVHPGFMTDWQQPFVVLLTQANGVSVIHETVYENRFGYTKTLSEMGADITLSSACLGSKPCRFTNHDYMHSCIVQGPTLLQSAAIEIPDLRAGFAYLIAALCAVGTSEITGISYVERGYSQVPERLRSIGAHIEVVE